MVPRRQLLRRMWPKLVLRPLLDRLRCAYRSSQALMVRETSSAASCCTPCPEPGIVTRPTHQVCATRMEMTLASLTRFTAALTTTSIVSLSPSFSPADLSIPGASLITTHIYDPDRGGALRHRLPRYRRRIHRHQRRRQGVESAAVRDLRVWDLEVWLVLLLESVQARMAHGV